MGYWSQCWQEVPHTGYHTEGPGGRKKVLFKGLKGAEPQWALSPTPETWVEVTEEKSTLVKDSEVDLLGMIGQHLGEDGGGGRGSALEGHELLKAGDSVWLNWQSSC